MDSLASLPIDVLYEICEYINVTDLYNLSFCNKQIKHVLYKHRKFKDLLDIYTLIFENNQIDTTYLFSTHKSIIIEQCLINDDRIIILNRQEDDKKNITTYILDMFAIPNITKPLTS